MSSPSSLTNALTNEGLPLSRRCSVDSTNPDASDSPGPTRRISIGGPHQLVSTICPALPSLKRPLSEPSLLTTRPSKSLKVGPATGSLLDEDDDLSDYFGTSIGSTAAVSRSSTPASDAYDSSSNTSSASSSISQWNIDDIDIPTLPSFYPLEKSATFLQEGASASALANRITDVLQARSIDATYDAKHAKVDCISEAKVEFRIRLYRSMGGLIVEVQRREGFDVSYIQDVFAILDAAESK